MRFLFTLGALTLTPMALAADHTEAPGASADAVADIADFYAWDADGKLNTIITFAPLTAAGGDPTYDADVLYGVHIDTDDDNMPDTDIWFRFGQNGAGDWGVQVTGVGDDPMSGAVGENIDLGGDQWLYAGLRDDPFFFDLAGYGATLASGDLSFTTADSIAGLNVTAIALSMDSPGSTYQAWSTTSRK